MYTVMQRSAAHKSSGIPLLPEKRVGSSQNSEPMGQGYLRAKYVLNFSNSTSSAVNTYEPTKYL